MVTNFVCEKRPMEPRFLMQFWSGNAMNTNAIRENKKKRNKKQSKNRTEIQSYYYMQMIPLQLILLFFHTQMDHKQQ